MSDMRNLSEAEYRELSDRVAMNSVRREWYNDRQGREQMSESTVSDSSAFPLRGYGAEIREGEPLYLGDTPRPVEYCGGSSITGMAKHWTDDSIEALQRRVARLEARMDHAEVDHTDTAIHLNDKSNRQVDTDRRIQCYEQQIEEISGKWQAAEEYARSYKSSCDRLTCELDMNANTISELRKKLEVSEGMRRDAAEKYVFDNDQLKAIIAEKNREIAGHDEVVSILQAQSDRFVKANTVSAVEAKRLRDLLTQKARELDSLRGIYDASVRQLEDTRDNFDIERRDMQNRMEAETVVKNRELEVVRKELNGLNKRYSADIRSYGTEDAKLGALVRQMPDGQYIGKFMGKWRGYRGDPYETAEEALGRVIAEGKRNE